LKKKSNTTKNSKSFRKLISSFLVVFVSLAAIILSYNYRWILIEQFYLLTSKNFKKYTQLGVPVPTQYTVHGIDVSRYQGVINWKMVSQMNDNGIKIRFAFIKASQGSNYRDPLFRYNWNNSGKYAIARAPYHYFLPCEDGKAQANNFLNIIDEENSDLPPVIDVEEIKSCNAKTLHTNLKACIKQIKKKYGKYPILYSGKDFYTQYLKGKYDYCKIWIAHYYVPELKDIPSWTFWQYSDKASVNGINVPVDLNAFSGNETQFENYVLQ